MKNKFLVVVIIGIFLSSSIIILQAGGTTQAKTTCPVCSGTGKLVCLNCNGTGQVLLNNNAICEKCNGTGTTKDLRWTLISSQKTASTSGGTDVSMTFMNQEDVSFNGTVIVEVKGDAGKPLASNSLSNVQFLPHENTPVKVNVNWDAYNIPLGLNIAINPDLITCPKCGGAGTWRSEVPCPDCEGTGYVTCTNCQGTGFVGANVVGGGGSGSGLSIPMFAIEAVVGVVAVAAIGGGTVLVVKKRKVSEKSLRKYSSSEFNTWVLNKLGGRSQSGSSSGIDGFTSDGRAVSIRQSDDVGKSAIETFAYSMGKAKARKGLVVAFSFSSDASSGRMRAKLNYGLDVELMTVKDLLDGRGGSY
jgi:hypothetical protein